MSALPDPSFGLRNSKLLTSQWWLRGGFLNKRSGSCEDCGYPIWLEGLIERTSHAPAFPHPQLQLGASCQPEGAGQPDPDYRHFAAGLLRGVSSFRIGAL